MLRFHQAVPLLLGAGALVCAASPLLAQSVEQELVVTAMDRDRSPVPDLRPEDLEIREDGALREVLRTSQDTEPRQIALLVDTSQAAERAIADFRSSVAAFVDEMGGRHEISLISFGGPPRILVGATRDSARLHEGVGRLFAQSSTAAYLLDAIRETTAGFVKREADRPVIVVLGVEGLDHSHTSASPVLKGLERTGISVHTVVLKTRALTTQAFGGVGAGDLEPDPFAQWRLERDRGLNQAPRLSGGSRRDLMTSMGASAALRELADELQSQYLVVYARPNTIVPPKNIEVAAARSNLTVRRTPVRASQ